MGADFFEITVCATRTYAEDTGAISFLWVAFDRGKVHLLLRRQKCDFWGKNNFFKPFFRFLPNGSNRHQTIDEMFIPPNPR